MVAGQQEKTHLGSLRHCVKSPPDNVAAHLIRLKHVPANHDEAAALPVRKLAQGADGVNASAIETGLGRAS